MVALGAIGLKLWTLTIKTVAKPLAKRFKDSAVDSPILRKLCINYAQLHHKWEYRLSVRLLGHRQMKDVKPLSEEKALVFGADILSELFVFGVGAAIIVFEMTRKQIEDSRKSESSKALVLRKEKYIEDRFAAIEYSLEDILANQNLVMKQLESLNK